MDDQINKYLIPGAIILAGAVIAVAVIYSVNGPSPKNTGKGETAAIGSMPVVTSNDFVLGEQNAPVTVVEYGDFQCPFSKRGADTVNALKQKYGNKLMFVYKNLPLGFHPEAMPSAKAALAAGRQGKFYEFHDKLYENQDTLGEALYLKIATELGLNMKRFNTDRNSPEIESQIKADAEQAGKLGFNGTPGFALNGVKVLGAYPVEHFEKIISALGVG